MMRTALSCWIFVLLTRLAFAEVLTIDFAQDQGPMSHRASGFLHGMTATSPVDSIVAPLKPRLMRFGPQMIGAYSRTIGMGAKFQIVLSDGYGYRSRPGLNGDWFAWENHVRTSVGNALAANQKIEWDIWNEPNASQFWTGTMAELFETWRRAVVIIRQLDPSAVIVGPSIASFDMIYLKAFLQYAKTNRVLPTALCWHEIGGSASVRGIAMNVQAMRTYLAAQGMNVPKIYINEMTSSTSQHNPGLIVRHFAEIERARVDGACKSCWNESVGSNCSNQSLDGLVTNSTRYPRSAWWAYKSYADITGRMVGTVPGSIPFSVDGVAGQDAAKREARAVIGRYAGSGSLDVKLINLNSVPYLTGSGTIHVTAKRIPNTGESRLISPTTAIDANYSIANNSLQFTISSFPDSNAYAIQFTPGGPAALKGTAQVPKKIALRVKPNASRIGVIITMTGVANDDPVLVSVYDTQGRHIQSMSGRSKASTFSIAWNAHGRPTGIYLVRIAAGKQVFQEEALLIR